MENNKINEFLFKTKEFFHTYDPSNFSLHYAIKSSIGLIICAIVSHFFISNEMIIFSILPCVFIFYMNNFKAVGFKKILYLLSFMAISAIFALIIPFLIKLEFYIAFPTFVWIFLVIFSGAFSLDAQRVGMNITILLMAMLISASLDKFNSNEGFLAVIIGSSIATVFRTFTFYTYGGFTRRSFFMLLNDLIYMCENIKNNKYEEWQIILTTRINNLKELFESKSVNIKDPSLIKHQEMAMFYLLKCEEISLTLFSLRTLLKSNKNDAYVKNIQDEIIYNLNELKKIFIDEKVNLKTFTLDRLKKLNTMPILCASIEVLYYKFDLFRQGGARTIKLKQDSNPLTLENIKNRFNFKDKYFKFSIKVALATSFSMFLAIFFQIDHGIWIAMSVFTLFKETINSTTINNKLTIYASLIGFGGGLLIIFITPSNMLLFTLFLSYFTCIYFKHFSYFLATTFIMMNLAIFFASIGLDYETLIVYRMADFFAAFLIVYAFSFLWPSKSEDDIKPTLKETIINLKDFLISIRDKENYYENGNKVLFNINTIKNLLYESRTKKNKMQHIRLFEALIEINSLCISLNDYLYSNYAKVQVKEQSDITILITRFKMMENISNDLPFYFYEQVNDKILTNDDKIKYFINKISKRQDVVYKYLTD